MHENAQLVLKTLTKKCPEWQKTACANHRQIYIDIIAGRQGTPAILPKTASQLMAARINAMSITQEQNAVSGEYLVFINQLLEEIQRFHINAQEVYNLEISFLTALLDEKSTDILAGSKIRVIAIYQSVLCQATFYPDIQYEGDEIAKYLGIHLVVESINTDGTNYLAHYGVPQSSAIPVLHFQHTQGDRLAHYHLHRVNDTIIPHCIHGTGNCLFDAFGLALIELSLSESPLYTAENIIQRRKQQQSVQLEWTGVSNSCEKPSYEISTSVGNDSESKVEYTSDNGSTQPKKNRICDDVDILFKARNLAQTLVCLEKITITAEIRQLGACFKAISWDEENVDCIRNKHAYRNRHKNKGNKKNEEGAKINIEYLAMLNNVTSDSDLMLISMNISDFKQGLKTLIKKVEFTILAETESLTDSQKEQICAFPTSDTGSSHDEDIPFLQEYSAFLHDQKCLARISEKLNHFNEKQFGSIDLSEKINRYQLGYLFCQIGEAAKEISHYLKSEPEAHEKHPSLIYRIFSALAKYRQKIKDKPYIVSQLNFYQLKQMQYFFNLVRYDLQEIVAACGEFDHSQFSEYCNGDLSKAFINKYEAKLRHISQRLEFGIHFTKKRLSINSQISREQQLIVDIKSEIEISQKLPVTNQSLEQPEYIKKFFNSKMAKMLKGMSRYYHDDIISMAEFNHCERSIMKLFRNAASQEKKINTIWIGDEDERNKKLKGIKAQLGKYIDHIKCKFEDTCGVLLTEDTNIISELTKIYSDLNITIKEKEKNSLAALQHRLHIHKAALSALQDELIQINQFSSLTFNSLEDVYPKTVKFSKFQKKIIVAIKEISFLNIIYNKINRSAESSSIEGHLMAAKMAFGFIGQIYKEILKLSGKSKETSYILERSVMAKDMIDAMIIRHKQIMHNMADCDDAHVHHFGKTKVTPWLQDFIYMTQLFGSTTDNSLGMQYTPNDQRLSIEPELLTEDDFILYIRYKRIAALNRFLKSEQAIVEYQSLVIPENSLPELATELHWQASKSYRDMNLFEECTYQLVKASSAAKKITDVKLRQRKITGFLFDLSITHIHLDNPQEAYKQLCKVEKLGLHDDDQIIGHYFLISSIEGYENKNFIAKSRLEFLIISYFETLRSQAPGVLLGIIGQLCHVYAQTRDYKSLEHTLNLSQEILKHDFHKLYPSIGKSSQYFQIIFEPTVIFYKMSCAIKIKNPQSRKVQLQAIYDKYFMSHDARSNFIYLQQNDERKNYKLQLEILLKKFERAKVTMTSLGISAAGNSTPSIKEKCKQVKLRIIDMRMAVGQYMISCIKNRIYTQEKYAVDHKKDLEKSTQEICNFLLSAAAIAVENSSGQLAVALAEKSVLYGCLSALVRNSFQTELDQIISNHDPKAALSAWVNNFKYDNEQVRSALEHELKRPDNLPSDVIARYLGIKDDSDELAQLISERESLLTEHIVINHNPCTYFSNPEQHDSSLSEDDCKKEKNYTHIPQ